MYAIIADGGRQYKVIEGQELEVDYRDVAKGESISFDNVLALSGDSGVTLGGPTVKGASVTAEVLGVKLGDKILIQKFRRRKNYRRKAGHRQVLTRVKISRIAAP
jgi:large subunit ribosomal protein L21